MTDRSSAVLAADPAALLQRIRDLGHQSVFDIVRQPRHEFAASLGDTEPSEANALYDAAMARASGITRFHTALLAHEEPGTRSLAKLGSGDARQLMTLSLGSDIDYEKWFGRAGRFASDDSVASLFSPASYLVDLYRPAKTLHATTSPLHIAKRRPDLAALVLSQPNMDSEVSTLDLANELLTKGIGESAIHDTLAKALYPFHLPYDDYADEIDRGFEDLLYDSHRVWGLLNRWSRYTFLLEAPNVKHQDERYTSERVRSALRMAPQTYHLLGTAYSEANTKACWGDATLPITDGSLLLSKASLTTPELFDLLAVDRATVYDPTKTAYRAATADEYGAQYLNYIDDTKPAKTLDLSVGTDKIGTLQNGSVKHFDRMQRLIRLKRHSALTFEELDWLIAQREFAEVSLTETARMIAAYNGLRGRFAMSVDAFAALIGKINPYALPGHVSFLEQCFGAALLPFIDKKVEFKPDDTTPTHVTARAALAKGLGIDDFTLYAIASIHTPPASGGSLSLLLDDNLLASLYRLATIPQLANRSLAECLSLWSTMSDVRDFTDVLCHGIGRTPDNVVYLIERTLEVSDWLQACRLDVPTLLAMTARKHPSTATPDILAFLRSIRTSAGAVPSQFVTSRLDSTLVEEQLSRHVGAEFGLKANVALAMTRWLDEAIAAKDKWDVEDEFPAGYSRFIFWNDILTMPDDEIPPETADIVDIEKLVRYCHLLGQFALICKFGRLTEQDIVNIIGTPKKSYLHDHYASPTLTTIYWLSRFVTWRDTMPGVLAAALQDMHEAAGKDTVVDPKRAEIMLSDMAQRQQWDIAATKSLYEAVVSSQKKSFRYPPDFRELQLLIDWMYLHVSLGLAPADLKDMSTLLDFEPTATATDAVRSRLSKKVLAAAHAKTP